MKLLSLAAGLVTIAVLELVALELGESLVVAVIAGALLALDPASSFARASGMEIELFAALVIAALLFALRRRPLMAGALPGVSVLARPEDIVLLPLYAALLVRGPAHERAGGGRLAAALGLAMLPAAVYAAFCVAVTGHALPNTFYAKFAAHGPFGPRGVGFVWANYVDDLPWFAFEAGTALLLLGAFRMLRRSGWRSAIVLGMGALLFLAAASSRDYVAGHYFYWERWIDPCIPFLLLAIAHGIEEMRTGLPSLHRGAAQRPRPVPRSDRAKRGAAATPAARVAAPGALGGHQGWIAGVAIAGILVLIRVPPTLHEAADQFAWNAQNVDEQNVALGRWIAANTPADAVVAVNDAGALRFFGGRTTIDLLGLNNHRVLAHDPTLGQRPLEALRVGYLVVFPATFSELVQSLPLRALQAARSPHYTICHAPQDVMVIYRLERAS